VHRSRQVSSAAKARPAPAEVDDKTPMSYDEKRTLSAQMNKLPGTPGENSLLTTYWSESTLSS